MKNINVIIIGGPTASGKTDVSLYLAQKLETEIISCDSRQIYKYLNIGTAKPSKEELAIAKHHFIDTLEPDVYFSAGHFAEQALPILQKLNEQGKTPIIVGGSGFYIDALCYGMFDENADTPERKANIKKYNKLLKELGRDYLYDELQKVDPIAAEQYSDRNPRRIIRALEYYDTHKSPFSEVKNTIELPNIKPSYWGVQWEREALYDRINLRTELMWEQGLIKETEDVLNMGFSPELNSLNTVGYKECIAFLNGDMTKMQAIEEMQKNTRRYAKRQLTWFKRYGSMNYLTGNAEEIADEIIKQTSKK